MTTLIRGLRTAPILALLFVAAAAVAPTRASGQATPEGTEIITTATVTYTDANGNSYDPVEGSVTIIVGFKSGLAVTTTEGIDRPDPGTTDHTVSFIIQNNGNGADTVSVAVGLSADPSIENLRYLAGGVTFTTLTDLNDQLAGMEIASTDTIQVTVIYDVPDGTGGQSSTVTLTATSVRDPAETSQAAKEIVPAITGTFALSPDTASVSRLPSNSGTAEVIYEHTLTLTNNQTGNDEFALAATSGDEAIVVVVGIEVDGSAASGTGVLAPGASATIVVKYTVASAAAANASADITLTATSEADSLKEESAGLTVTVIRPALTITKTAYHADKSAALAPTDSIAPGVEFLYLIEVENTGNADAVEVTVDDDLPETLTFVGTEPDDAAETTSEWTFTHDTATNLVQAVLGVALEPTASRYFYIRVEMK